MVNRNLYHSDEQFSVQVQSALKRYRKAEDLRSHIATTWPTVEAYTQSRFDVVDGIRNVFQDALAILSVSYRMEAQILIEHYVDGKQVLALTMEYNLSESEFHRQRKRGINELAIVLKKLNEEVSKKQLLSLPRRPDFQQQVLAAVLSNNLVHTMHLVGQYPHPQSMVLVVDYLKSTNLTFSDRQHIITQLHDLYYTACGDSLKSVTARQNSLYLLGTFAALESNFLLNQAWNSETHPWPMRAALLGSPSNRKYEEYLYKLNHNDEAREVARTFPRVFYGDQPLQSEPYVDDHKPNYAKTLQFYLSNYPRFLDEASLGLALYISCDFILTKGDGELRKHPQLMKMLRQALELEPLHPLARREWIKLQSLARKIKDVPSEDASRSH